MDDQKSVHLSFSTRGFVRLLSFLCAVVVTLGAGAAVGHQRAGRYRILLEDSYSQALTGLATNLSSIAATLSKGLYASTPVQISSLSAQLWKDASAAKTALTSLPVGELHLDGTNRFLSQIGDYAMSLSRKSVSGADISEKEREQFAALCRYGRDLADQVYRMEQSIVSGQITMEEMKQQIETINADNGAEPAPGDGVSEFRGIEDSFADYPELEYDGPFSDHILTKEPLMLKGVAPVGDDEALLRAAAAAGVEPSSLARGSDEESLMPSYSFHSDELWMGVTKQGGFVTYLMRQRQPGEAALSTKEAVTAASDYLAGQGFSSLVPTWYQTVNGACTINFAYQQGDVTVYPDLIKVEVALDNGEILAFDARGYLSNHYNRTIANPSLTEPQAREIVGRHLTPETSKLCIIPTAGEYEVLCYEFSTVSETGDRVLVYINADNGVEEQILLLTQGESGAFVK